MAGAILAGGGESFLAGLGWLVRRGSSLFVSVMFALKKLPPQMWSSISDHRDGVGFYADPLGKPSLLTHWRGLVEFSYSSVSLTPKRTTEEGLAAAGASSSPDWDGDGVTVVDKGGYLEFLPPPPPPPADGGAGIGDEAGQPLVGVIFFPGALILPTAYAPLARTMARKGHPSYVLRFGFNLATNGWETAGEIISPQADVGGDAGGAGTGADACAAATGQSGEPENCRVAGLTPTKWVLVGHSMGAVGIEMFYPDNSARVHGVVYMGAGNMIGDALAGAGVPAMILRGSRDPFCPPEALERSKHKLPKDTETVVVEGGSHRGFASYTRQPLDWEATITQGEQRRLIVEALVDFIDQRVDAKQIP